jgi:signal peptidase I
MNNDWLDQESPIPPFPTPVYSEPDTAPSAPRKNKWLSALKEMLETLVLAGILFLIINAFTARIQVLSVSMLHTLEPGNQVVVYKLAYRNHIPARGDIVVFNPPNGDTEAYIKRVIGLPGETIEIRDGIVFINGLQLQETYLQDEPITRGSRTWIVPQDSIFVMGDNRNNSSDSRVWGTVPLENLIGKAILIYWPLDKLGWIPHLEPVYITP